MRKSKIKWSRSALYAWLVVCCMYNIHPLCSKIQQNVYHGNCTDFFKRKNQQFSIFFTQWSEPVVEVWEVWRKTFKSTISAFAIFRPKLLQYYLKLLQSIIISMNKYWFEISRHKWWASVVYEFKISHLLWHLGLAHHSTLA